MRAYDLGELDGVELTFSDATPMAARCSCSPRRRRPRTERSADRSSERSTSTATSRRLRTIDRRYKVEGVHAAIDTGVMDLLFVCDQDEPDTASPLLSAAMPLDAAIEH